jgi:hypothetical protein
MKQRTSKSRRATDVSKISRRTFTTKRGRRGNQGLRGRGNAAAGKGQIRHSAVARGRP